MADAEEDDVILDEEVGGKGADDAVANNVGDGK